MCGRVTAREPEKIPKVMRVRNIVENLDSPRFNLVPTQAMPIVFIEDGERVLRHDVGL